MAINEAAYGPDHPNIATRLNDLATILWDLGQLENAWPLQERALAITKAAPSARSGQAGGDGGS